MAKSASSRAKKKPSPPTDAGRLISPPKSRSKADERLEQRRAVQRAATLKYRRAHPEKTKASSSAWRAKNHARVLLYKAKARAKQTARPFDLLPQDIVIPKRCPVLGILLKRHVGEGGKTFDDSPTLDCIVPEKGYVRGNVAVISGRANRIKNDATLNELRKVLAWLRRALLLERP